MLAGVGQILLVFVGSLLAIGCALAAFIIWDFRRQRRIEDRARLYRRLGHVRSVP